MNWTARGGLIVLQIKQLKTRNEQKEGDVRFRLRKIDWYWRNDYLVEK